MKNYPKIFVIIANHNGGDYLKKCLTSVFKNDYPCLESVLVDNNSTDGSFEFAKKIFSKAVFIQNEANMGVAAAYNIGIKYALERMADYVLLLQNNIEIDNDFILKLAENAKKEDCAIAGPVIFKNENKEILFAGGKINWLAAKADYLKKIKTEESFETDFISEHVMLVNAEIFKKNGLFQEEYFMYWWNVDFCLRAKKAGFACKIITGSWAYCAEKNKNNPNDAYWMLLGALIFFSKNTPTARIIFNKTASFIRRAGNWLHALSGRNRGAVAEKKAYKDFKNAKF